MTTDGKTLYSLIPLEDFKAILGTDDREDRIARFCLVTGTFTIEQYCKRRFLSKKHFEYCELHGDLFVPLKEYPVSKILGLFAIRNGEIIEPEFYRIVPDCGTELNIPFSIELSPALTRLDYKVIKVVYWAGYNKGAVPADLVAACLELASWNMNRYKGRRVGMTGNIRGAGKEGEHFEMSMPENVKTLLEPYRRKTI
jgi:hypothetical protein